MSLPRVDRICRRGARTVLGLFLTISIAGNLAAIIYKLKHVYRASREEDPIYHGVRRQAVFDSLNAPQGSLVFIGDSLTEDFEWSEYFRRPLVNRGISGDTTVDILRRLGSITLLKPSKVFIMVGVNDATQGFSLDDAYTSYEAAVRTICANGTEIYLQSVLPVTDRAGLVLPTVRGRVHYLNTWISQFNTRIAGLANGSTIFYLDLSKIFTNDLELDPFFTVDGIHLSGQGYLAWASAIAPYIEMERKLARQSTID